MLGGHLSLLCKRLAPMRITLIARADTGAAAVTRGAPPTVEGGAEAGSDRPLSLVGPRLIAHANATGGRRAVLALLRNLSAAATSVAAAEQPIATSARARRRLPRSALVGALAAALKEAESNGKTGNRKKGKKRGASARASGEGVIEGAGEGTGDGPGAKSAATLAEEAFEALLAEPGDGELEAAVESWSTHGGRAGT